MIRHDPSQRVPTDPDDVLDAALAALDAEPRPDDVAFTAAVLNRLAAADADEATRARDWLRRTRSARRRERRLQRYGLAGVGAGATACLAVSVAAGVGSGAAAWSPLAVFALGLTTAVAAWMLAGRGA